MDGFFTGNSWFQPRVFTPQVVLGVRGNVRFFCPLHILGPLSGREEKRVSIESPVGFPSEGRDVSARANTQPPTTAGTETEVQVGQVRPTPERRTRCRRDIADYAAVAPEQVTNTGGGTNGERGILGSFCLHIPCYDFWLMFNVTSLLFMFFLGSCFVGLRVITFTSLFGLNEGDNC